MTTSTRRDSNTSAIDTMPFRKSFEAHVNDNMSHDIEQGSSDFKGKMPVSPEAEDREFTEKMAMKDQGHQPPPRFSTIFDTKGPTTPSPTKAFESYPQQPVRKPGIYIARPLFWALLAIFLFESAALFAYTVIGLVNSMPARLLHPNNAGTLVAGCDCKSQPINISPNFFMGQGPQSPIVAIETTTTSISQTPSSTSTSSTSSSSSSAAPAVSNLADLIKSAAQLTTTTSSTTSPSSGIATVTPPRETIKSTTVLTVDPSGSTLAPRPTVTSTKVVDPDATPALSTRDEPTSGVGSAAGEDADSAPSHPTLSISLKSHGQLVDKPTQEAEAAPSSTSIAAASESGCEQGGQSVTGCGVADVMDGES